MDIKYSWIFLGLDVDIKLRSFFKSVQKLLKFWKSLSRDIWKLKNGANSVNIHVFSTKVNLLFILCKNGFFPKFLHAFHELLLCLLKDLRRTDIDFCEHHKKWYVKRPTNSHVFLCHSANTHIATNDNHCVIRLESSQTKDSCFKIFLMPAKINKVDNFTAILVDVVPVFVLILGESFRQNLLSFTVKANDFLSNWRCSSAFDFVVKV